MYQQDFDAVVCNPAALTLLPLPCVMLFDDSKPFVEVHISNIYQRESFRRRSYFADIAIGSIVGLGFQGYELASLALLEHLTK